MWAISQSVNQSTVVNVKVARTHANVGSSLGSISQLGSKRNARNTGLTYVL